MAASLKDVTQLERVGGHDALDFANTVSWRHQPREIDYLRQYHSLMAWSRQTGFLSAREAKSLRHLAGRFPRKAAAALARARALREAIFSIGRAITRNAAPPPDAVATLHAARIQALHHATFVPARRARWAPRWGAERDFDRPWWPVATAFASLLENPGLHPLGICPECSWLFLDSSRNRSRRWCSSGDCGNRARGRRFRARHSSR